MKTSKDDNKDKEPFTIAGESSSFKSKTDSIFGCLDVLEKKHTAVEKVRDKGGVDRKYWKSEPSAEPVQSTNRQPGDPKSRDDSYKRTHRSRSPPSRGRRSGRNYSDRGQSGCGSSDFKVPRRPRDVPGFRKEPDKWQKYTLSDVGSDQMTDRANSRAAFGFLDELRKRKQSEEERDDDGSDDEQKIMFKKPKMKFKPTASSQSSSADDSSERKQPNSKDNATPFVYGSSKVVQAEYQVGKREKTLREAKPHRPPKDRTVASSDVISLSHLMDEEDDDDDDDDV